jgi:hypothetical protein
MQHSEECVTDLHLKSLAYRRQYLANFMSTPTAAGVVENRLTRERFDNEEECLESLLMNNQSLLESLYPALGNNRDTSKSIFSHLGVNQVMSSADIGVVRLPLKEVSLLCQIGKDISPESPLFVLVQGRRKDDVTSTFLVSVSHTGAAHSARALCLEVKEISGELFAGVKNTDIKDVQYCSETRQLVVHTAQEVSVYKIQDAAGSLVTARQSTLVASTQEMKVIEVGQGQVFIQEKEVITAYAIKEEKLEVAEGAESTSGQADHKKDKEEAQIPTRAAIDPEKVSIEDIKRYEALMKGKAVSAISNA